MRHRAPSSAYLAEKGISAEKMAKYQRLGAEAIDTGSVESAFTSHTITSRILLEKIRQKQARARRARDDQDTPKPEG
jgi:hypothetical protein